MNNNRYMWTVLIIHWLVWGIIALDRMLPTYVAPYIINDLHLTQAQFGMIMSTLTVTWAVMGTFGGHLSDRIGRAKVVFPSILWFSITTGFAALARSFGQMAGILGLVGLGQGSYWGSGVAHVSEVWPEEKRGFALGFHQTGFPIIGMFIGGAFAGYVALNWGWRAVFPIAAIAGIVLSIVFRLLIRESKLYLDSKNEKDSVTHDEHKVSLKDATELFSNRNWLINLIIIALSLVGFWAVSTFIVIYLTEVKGFSIAIAGGIVGIVGAGGFFGQFLSAWYSDRIGRRPAYLVATLSGAIGTLILIMSNSVPIVIIGLLITGYGIYGPIALGEAVLPGDVVKKRLVGTSAGITMLVAEFFGIIGSVLGGRCNDYFGQTGSLWLGVIAFSLATVGVLFLGETAPRFSNRQSDTAVDFVK